MTLGNWNGWTSCIQVFGEPVKLTQMTSYHTYVQFGVIKSQECVWKHGLGWATAAPRAGSGPEPEAVKSSVKMEESKAGNIVHVDHGCTHFPQYFSELNFDYRNVRTNPRFTFTKNVKWHFQSPTFDMESPTPQIPLKRLWKNHLKIHPRPRPRVSKMIEFVT